MLGFAYFCSTCGGRVLSYMDTKLATTAVFVCSACGARLEVPDQQLYGVLIDMEEGELSEGKE